MFWRLFGTYGLLLLVAIGLLGLVIVRRVERHDLEQIEDSLHTKAVLVRKLVSDWPADETGRLQEQMIDLRKEITTRITLLAADGRVLADSEENPARMENHLYRPEVQTAAKEGFGTSTRFSTTLHQSMMYAALRTENREPVAYVRVALPLGRIEAQLAGLRRLVGTATAATGLAALVLAFGLARRITRPLRELTTSAERIAAGKYGRKVYAGGRDEIAVLARTFNAMSERLADQFAQLAEDRQQLRMILSGMVEGVVALDAGQRILFANASAGRLLGFPPEAGAGRRLWEIVRRPALQELVQRAFAEPGPLQEQLNWSGPAANSLTVHAARLPGTPPRGLVLVLHDTSELRRLERLRREFAANVSHELKTPLSIIKAYVETLLGGAADDPEHRDPFLHKIAEQADRLHALILDLLSLSRIETGAEAFQFEVVPLGPVVEACLERYQARAETRDQALRARPPEPPDPAAEAVWADAEAVAQILDNLVDNALKYTPPGGRIEVRWRAEEEQVCLEIEDSGIGIPEADLPRIFERFYRVDKARSRELGGTGLGLAIVKHLVHALHGSVRVRSRLDEGTTFTVILPGARVT